MLRSIILLDFNRSPRRWEKNPRHREWRWLVVECQGPRGQCCAGNGRLDDRLLQHTPDCCDIEREEKRIGGVEARSNLDLHVIEPRSADREWPLLFGLSNRFQASEGTWWGEWLVLSRDTRSPRLCVYVYVFSTDGGISRRSIVEVEDTICVKLNRGWNVDNKEGIKLKEDACEKRN